MLVAVCLLAACDNSHGGTNYRADGGHDHVFRGANNGEVIVHINGDGEVKFTCSPGFHADTRGINRTQWYGCGVNPEPDAFDTAQ